MRKKYPARLIENKILQFRSQEAIDVALNLMNLMSKNLTKDSTYARAINNYYAEFIMNMPKDISPDKVTKEYFWGLIKKQVNDVNKIDGGLGPVFTKVFVTFLRKGLYNKRDFLGWDNSNLLDNLEDESFRGMHIIKRAFEMQVPFSQMQVVSGKVSGRKKNVLRLLVYDTSNEFIQGLIKDVFDEGNRFTAYAISYEDNAITRRFKESFGDLKLPTNVMEFTPDTFKQQVIFFYQKGTRFEIGALKAIYMYIINNCQGGKTPFTVDNGMDSIYLMRKDVAECVEGDYQIVKLSLLKDVPKFDKWLVVTDAKTGRCSDIRNQNRYVKCTFENIPTKYKDVCKRWFAFGNNTAIQRKVSNLVIIADFLTEIDKRHNKIKNLRTDVPEITFQDVIDFITKNGDVIKDVRASIVNFLNFIKIERHISVDPACFKFLPTTHSVYNCAENVGGNIPLDDYVKLNKGLCDWSKRVGAYPIDKITYALFVILSLMELRLASILSLRISDIKEYGDGRYCITVATKTSLGTKKTFRITPIIYKVFQYIVNVTSEYRSSVPYNVRDMLFITKNGKIIEGHAFNNIIKKVCNQCGIRKITSGNIRKTYMTNVAKSLRKNGGSAIGYEQLFDHKRLETTFGTYAVIENDEIMVKISNRDSVQPISKIGKHIMSDVEFDKKQMVSDEAGYCQKEMCRFEGMADCFVCRNFVTSTSFYDSFLLKREKLKKLLITNGLGEEIKEGYLLILKIINMYISEMEKIKNIKEIGSVK